MKKLIIRHSEEAVDFVVIHEDGTEQHIKNFNYDDHGSRAMEDAGTALENLAKALGAEILEVHLGEDPDADPLGE